MSPGAPNAGARGAPMPPRTWQWWRSGMSRRAAQDFHRAPPQPKAQPPMRADEHVLTFIMDRMATPIGDMLIVFDRDGKVRAADFFDHEQRMRTLLRQQYAREGTVAIIEGA